MKALILKLLIIFLSIPAHGIAEEEIDCKGDRECLSSEFRCESDRDCMSFEFCDEGKCAYPMAEWRKGLEMEIRGGLSACIQMKSNCEGRVGEIKPGGGGGIFVGIRPNPRFSVGIDFGYFAFSHDLEGGYSGTFNLNENVSSLPDVGVDSSDYDSLIRFLNIMAEIRGYIPYGYKGTGFGDIYFKLGVGYMSFKEEYSFELIEEVDIYPRRLHSPLNLKMGMGTTFYFVQDSTKGDLGVGINVDYLFFFAKGDVDCGNNVTSSGYDLYCRDVDGYNSRLHTMQFTAHFKWVVPIF